MGGGMFNEVNTAEYRLLQRRIFIVKNYSYNIK